MSSKTLKYSAAGLVAGASMLLALPALAAGLTDSQISSITSLLSSFGADSSVIANVTIALHGGTPSTGHGDDHNQGNWQNGSTTPSGGGWGVGSSTPPGHKVLCPQIRLNLHRGDDDSKTGGNVTDLQNFLIQQGYLTASSTGFFGALTQKGLALFQKASGLGGDGSNFGPRTNEEFGKRCGQIGGGMGMGSTTWNHMPPPTGTSTASTTAH